MTIKSDIRALVKKGRDFSICSDCAVAGGGEWPEGHLATVFIGPCRFCGEEKVLAAGSDWNWPAMRSRLVREF